MNDDTINTYIATHNGTPTSIAASASIIGSVGQQRRTVFEFVVSRGSTGATCDEIEDALGMSHQSASARLNDLSASPKLPKLLDIGPDTRKTRSGRAAMVYRFPQP